MNARVRINDAEPVGKPDNSLLKLVGARGLNRVQSSLYIGVSASKFDEMVVDGRMPRAKRVDGRKVWDKKRLDEAFEALPDDGAIAQGDGWEHLDGGPKAQAR